MHYITLDYILVDSLSLWHSYVSEQSSSRSVAFEERCGGLNLQWPAPCCLQCLNESVRVNDYSLLWDCGGNAHIPSLQLHGVINMGCAGPVQK